MSSSRQPIPAQSLVALINDYVYESEVKTIVLLHEYSVDFIKLFPIDELKPNELTLGKGVVDLFF